MANERQRRRDARNPIQVSVDATGRVTQQMTRQKMRFTDNGDGTITDNELPALRAVADAAADWLFGPPTFALDVAEKIERLKAALRAAGYTDREPPPTTASPGKQADVV